MIENPGGELSEHQLMEQQREAEALLAETNKTMNDEESCEEEEEEEEETEEHKQQPPHINKKTRDSSATTPQLSTLILFNSFRH